MEIAYAFLAENCEVMPDGRFHVFRGGLEGFLCENLPAIIPAIALVIRIKIPPSDRGKPHTLELEGIDPENQSFLPKAMTTIVPKDDPTPAERAIFHTFSANIGMVQFIKYGFHSFRMAIDGRSVGGLTFFVDPLPS
jgi:hypothetical protein